LDYDCINKFKSVLPNISNISNNGRISKLESVFPVDSIPAWVSIFTGLDPSEHGIIRSVDYFSQSEQNVLETSFLKGNTFWDKLSLMSKRVCIINPFVAYPVWPVNGIMASGPPLNMGKPQIYPNNIENINDIPVLGGVLERYPDSKELDQFYKHMWDITSRQADFAINLFNKEMWDFGFVSFLALDGIKHFFWRFCDIHDPMFSKNNEYMDAIRNFYIHLDKIIGRLINDLKVDSVLIFSDHGHGMRNTKLVNVNQILKDNGIIDININKYYTIFESIKRIGLDLISNFGIEDYVYKIARKIPKVSKALISSNYLYGQKIPKIHVADLHGMNPCGGVIVNDNENYEEVRSKIIEILYKMRDKSNNKKVFNWVMRREEKYCGKYLYKLPDVIFEMDSEYGVNWGINCPIFQTNFAHKIISGGHKCQGVYISSKKINNKESLKVTDLYDLIVSYFQ